MCYPGWWISAFGLAQTDRVMRVSLVRFLQPSGFVKLAVPSRWMYGNRLVMFANPGTWSLQTPGVQKNCAAVGAAYAVATIDTSPVTGAEVAANPANAPPTIG